MSSFAAEGDFVASYQLEVRAVPALSGVLQLATLSHCTNCSDMSKGPAQPKRRCSATTASPRHAATFLLARYPSPLSQIVLQLTNATLTAHHKMMKVAALVLCIAVGANAGAVELTKENWQGLVVDSGERRTEQQQQQQQQRRPSARRPPRPAFCAALTPAALPGAQARTPS